MTASEHLPLPGLHRLLVACPDRPGIVAAISGFLHQRGANIVDSAQHSTGIEGGTFFMRMEFALALDPADQAAFGAEFEREVAGSLGAHWRLWHDRRPKRIAILVSRHDHCLLDLLWRLRRHEIEGEAVVVVSNHPDLEADTRFFGIPFIHVPVTRETKPESERRILEILAAEKADLVVLARYMQILSGDFLNRAGVPLINIHHSFLPAFPGSGPYERAHERGVKLIGATAHYVTEELDAGPIIDQDVTRVSHREDVPALMRLGADIERIVFSRAIRLHCEDRVLVDENATVVF